MENRPFPSAAMIEAEHRRLGHQLGWRFLTGPEHNIESAAVVLVTANPGGNNFEDGKWFVEDGCAYVTESWKGYPPGTERLQQQVRRMFQLIGIAPEQL